MELRDSSSFLRAIVTQFLCPAVVDRLVGQLDRHAQCSLDIADVHSATHLVASPAKSPSSAAAPERTENSPRWTSNCRAPCAGAAGAVAGAAVATEVCPVGVLVGAGVIAVGAD